MGKVTFVRGKSSKRRLRKPRSWPQPGTKIARAVTKLKTMGYNVKRDGEYYKLIASRQQGQAGPGTIMTKVKSSATIIRLSKSKSLLFRSKYL